MRAALDVLVVLWASSVLGCDGDPGAPFQGDEVVLGAAAASSAASCRDANCAQLAPHPFELDERSPRRCPLSAGSSLEVVWSWSSFDAEGMPPTKEDCGVLSPCGIDTNELKLAASDDGTLWVVGLAVPQDQLQIGDYTSAGVWLARYAEDGTPLSSELADFEQLSRGDLLRYSMSLVPNGRGGMWLAVYKEFATEGFSDPRIRRWVRSYGSDGRQVGSDFELPDATAGYDSLVLAPAGANAFALQIDLNLVLIENGKQRSQRPLADDLEFLLGDAQGRLWSFASSGTPTRQPTLRHYGADSPPVWVRTFSGDFGSNGLASDSDGNTLRIGTIGVGPLGGSASDANTLIAHKISERGESLWCLKLQPDPEPNIEHGPGSVAAVADLAGTYWVNGPGYFTLDPTGEADPTTLRSGFLVYEISEDGRRCLVHDVAGVSSGAVLVPAPSGGLYYGGYGGFGLIQPK